MGPQAENTAKRRTAGSNRDGQEESYREKLRKLYSERAKIVRQQDEIRDGGAKDYGLLNRVGYFREEELQRLATKLKKVDAQISMLPGSKIQDREHIKSRLNELFGDAEPKKSGLVGIGEWGGRLENESDAEARSRLSRGTDGK